MTIPGYDLYKAGYLSNIKRSVCVVGVVPLKIIDIQYLQECANSEMRIRESLSQDDLETFLTNFEHGMVKYELRVTSYELLVESLKARVEIQIHELRVRIHELKNH